MTSSGHEKNHLLVIGALHVDEIASAESPLIQRASNAVSWHRSTGGVAANVALAVVDSLPCDAQVQLISAVGNDAAGRRLDELLSARGIACSLQRNHGKSTGRYTAVLDADGELSIGLSDVSLAEHLDGRRIIDTLDWTRIKAIMLDANLSEACLEMLARHAQQRGIAVAAMAVSPVKARRLLNIRSHLQLLFCNRREAIALCQDTQMHQSANDEPLDIHTLADQLDTLGFEQFVLTDGRHPVIVQSKGTRHELGVPTPRAPANNVNGAGDAMAGATFAHWSCGASLHSALQQHGFTIAADVVCGARQPPSLT